MMVTPTMVICRMVVVTTVLALVLPIPTIASHEFPTHENYLNRSKRAANDAHFTQEDKNAIIGVHNHVRANVAGASNMVAVKWNVDLEAEAQRWASMCAFEHPADSRSIGGFSSIGQNLFVSGFQSTPNRPVTEWASEAADYIHNTFSCDAGQVCGHYTQVIWAETTDIGCAREYCKPLTSAGPITKGYLVVCEYGPSGNMRNSDPYMKGPPCSRCPDEYNFCDLNLCSMKSSASKFWTKEIDVTKITIYSFALYIYHMEWRDFKF